MDDKDFELSVSRDRYEMEYIQKRTGATDAEIIEAVKAVGHNWVNVIFHLKAKLKHNSFF